MALYTSYNAARFEQTVRMIFLNSLLWRERVIVLQNVDLDTSDVQVGEALVVARRVLGANRALAPPAGVQHAYVDKFALVEAELGAAVVGIIASLSELGLSAAGLRTLVEWAAGGAEVSLRFSADLISSYAREESRNVVDVFSVTTRKATGFVGSVGAALVGDSTTRVTRTVTEHVWAVAAEWRVEAVRGTGRGERDVMRLAARAMGRGEHRTASKEVRPAARIDAAAEAPVTWLLLALDGAAPGLPARVVIDRSEATCKTPRRNPTAAAALACFDGLDRVFGAAAAFLQGDLAAAARAAAPETPPDLGSAHAGGLMVPAVLFDEEPQALEAERSAAVTAAAELPAEPAASLALPTPPPFSAEGAPPPSPVLDLRALNALLAEARVALRERLGEAARRAGGSGTALMLGGDEAAALVCAAYARRVTAHARDGLDYVEAMLRDQLVAAVGRVVGPADFDAYMRFHARRLFRPAYEPRPLCFAVRRSADHSPEGLIRIDAAPVGDAPAEPIFTVSAELPASPMRRMHFALSAETRVEFGGPVHLHAWLSTRFAGGAALQGAPLPPRTLSLVAAARQFSSFILLVGKSACVGGTASSRPSSCSWGRVRRHGP